MMIRALLLVLASLAAGCGAGGASTTSSAPQPTPVVTGEVTTFSIASRLTGIDYPISVFVPTDAATGPPPPAIYVLDAETRFATLQSVLQDAGVRGTLVGVANTGAAQRQVDFLEPGADPYYQFLVTELVPAIESRYRVDPARRFLSGHSSGGLFCMYAFFKHAPANQPFSAYICADGSYWQQPQSLGEAEAAMHAANAGHDVPLTLVLGGDQFGNLPYMDPLYQEIVAQHYAGLAISEHMYAVGHVPMDAPFFADALRIVLPTGR